MIAALLAIVFPFPLLLVVISLSNQLAVRRLGESPDSPARPMVSVLVPARNEAGHIAACLQALLDQDYPSFEVLVLDDESEDDTPAILAELAAADERLTTYRGRPLPAGWFGKSWACAQLADHARGDLLLFTDADTRHSPGTLNAAVNAAQQEGADLLAVWPRLEAVGLGERLLVPLIPWSVFSILSIPIAHRLPYAALSAGIGQFLLFRRRAYREVGGHAAVRRHAAEDLALCRRIKRRGLRWRMVDGREFVHTRMYTSLREAWSGLGKNLYPAFGYRPGLLLGAWLWIAAAAWAPLISLAGAALRGGSDGSAIGLAMAAIASMLTSWIILLRNMRQPVLLAALYPILIANGVLIAIQSMLLTRAGRATWKGRRLSSTVTRSP